MNTFIKLKYLIIIVAIIYLCNSVNSTLYEETIQTITEVEIQSNA